MVIFVSSPYAAVLEEIEDKSVARETILNLARKGCEKVLEQGHIPISPVLCFDGLLDERSQRDEAIEMSLALVKFCDGFLAVKSRYSKFSAGMIIECDLARRLKKPFITINGES